ncbi:hypothetical protein [Pannonibacter sp. P2PFMT1]|uniref:hypothetical protein n=1 Tax=Pannonibacter sp. P2PFMT1 TaxID=2003582 RepID=UPI0016441E30|nr:hypothetical protein [Pannonibacter sp. P2PFMT1]
MLSGKLVAKKGGYSVYALVEQISSDPLEFRDVGFVVISPEGRFVGCFPSSQKAIQKIDEEIAAELEQEQEPVTQAPGM